MEKRNLTNCKNLSQFRLELKLNVRTQGCTGRRNRSLAYYQSDNVICALGLCLSKVTPFHDHSNYFAKYSVVITSRNDGHGDEK